jgi:hypothetical protein
MRILDPPYFISGSVQSVVPRDWFEANTLFALEWLQQPVRVIILEIPLYPFWTEPSLVKREFLPRIKANDSVILNHELDAALHPTKTTVSCDYAIRFVAADSNVR